MTDERLGSRLFYSIRAGRKTFVKTDTYDPACRFRVAQVPAI